jgi:hypothetical protein
MSILRDRQHRALIISGLVVTGFGQEELMYGTRDIGTGREQVRHGMKGIGKLMEVAGDGTEVIGNSVLTDRL